MVNTMRRSYSDILDNSTEDDEYRKRDLLGVTQGLMLLL